MRRWCVQSLQLTLFSQCQNHGRDCPMEDSGSKACPWGAGASREAQPPPGSCLRQSKSGEEYPGSPSLSPVKLFLPGLLTQDLGLSVSITQPSCVSGQSREQWYMALRKTSTTLGSHVVPKEVSPLQTFSYRKRENSGSY